MLTYTIDYGHLTVCLDGEVVAEVDGVNSREALNDMLQRIMSEC